MKLESGFTFSKVKFDEQKDNHLVISLKAPKIEWEKKRNPIALIPCVDTSGSMFGQKIDFVRKTCLKLLDHLRPGDFFGVVTFSDGYQVVEKVVEVTQSSKDRIKATVGNLCAGGNTNLSGGLLAALEQANSLDLPKGTTVRVIVLTDGQANAGVSDHGGIIKILKGNLGNATVSAFGYGEGADQELLLDMSNAGKGNYAFIKNPEDALTAFAKELGGLLSTYGQNIVVDVAPHAGHSIVEVLSDVDVAEDSGKAKISLAEILSEETKHLVIQFRTGPQPQAFPRQTSVADISVTYDVLGDDGKVEHRSESLKAKVQFVKGGSEQDKPDPDLDQIVGLAQMVQAQIAAEEHAKAGNYTVASASMGNVLNSFSSRGLGSLANVARKLQGNYSDNDSYTYSSGYRTSVLSTGSRGMTAFTSDAEAVADMSLFSAANSTQTNFMNAFAEALPGIKDVPVQPTTVTAQITISPPAPNQPQSKQKSSRGTSKKRSRRW